MHCIQARAGASKTAQLFLKKLSLWKKNPGWWCLLCIPARGGRAIPVQRLGKGALAEKEGPYSPVFLSSLTQKRGKTHLVKLVAQNKTKGSKDNTLFLKSLRNTLKAEIGFCSSQGCPWVQRPLVR